MKKAAAIISAVVFASFCALAIDSATLTLTQDTAGRALTVTTNGVRVALSESARLVSVSNAGTNLVYVAPRVTAVQFAAMVAATNATPVAGGATYDFVGGNPMDSVTLQAVGGSSTVYLGVQK